MSFVSRIKTVGSFIRSSLPAGGGTAMRTFYFLYLVFVFGLVLFWLTKFCSRRLYVVCRLVQGLIWHTGVLSSSCIRIWIEYLVLAVEEFQFTDMCFNHFSG